MRKVFGLKGRLFFCGIKYKCNKCSCSDSGSTSFDSKLNNQSLSPPNTTKRPLTCSSKSAAPLSRVAACGFRPVCALTCLRSPYLSNDCPPSGCSFSWSKQNAVKHACFSVHKHKDGLEFDEDQRSLEHQNVTQDQRSLEHQNATQDLEHQNVTPRRKSLAQDWGEEGVKRLGQIGNQLGIGGRCKVHMKVRRGRRALPALAR